MKRLLSRVLDLIFNEVLPAMVIALQKQINRVMLWVQGAPLHGMVNGLQRDLHTLKAELFELHKQLLVVPSAIATTVDNGSDGDGVETIEINEHDVLGGNDETVETHEQLTELKGVDDHLRHLASEVLGALVNILANDLRVELSHLKRRTQIKLDEFAESAAIPISTALAGAKELEAVQLARQLPEVRGYIEELKKVLCEKALRKRLMDGLIGAANTSLQSFGRCAEQAFALAGKFEQHLTKKLDAADEATRKLLRLHLPQGSLRARAFNAVLQTTTKYDVRVGGFDGSVDMLQMAWGRSRVALTTDENQLVYLIEELKKLKDQESTAANWRDAAEGWISVLELRGQLRVQCGQAVLECMVADEKVLQALGAAKALMHIEGDAPPAALVTIIAQGPGAHIRKHGYRYTRRLDKELVLIRRVKELQMRAVTGVGTLLVATSIAVGNYFGRVMYDGVAKGFDSQSLLTWVPFAVIIGLLVFCCFGLCVCQCCKKKKCLCNKLQTQKIGDPIGQ